MMRLRRQQRPSSRHLEARGSLATTAMLSIALCVVAFLAPVAPAQSPAGAPIGPVPDILNRGSGTSDGDKPLADGIAVIVNAEIITVSEVQTELGDEIFRLKARYEGDEFKEHLDQKRYEILNRMIEHKLQLQEAKAQNISVSDEEVDQAWEQVRRNSTGFPPAAVQSKAVVREELMVRRVRDMEVRRGILVSPEEIRAYYEEQQQQFTSPGTHRIRQILLIPKLGETTETLKARAEVLMGQLAEGRSFEKLAEVFSDGSESVLGGDLGFVTKEELLAPLGKALDKLNPGEVSPLIETGIGIHILRLEENRPGVTQPFEKVKDAITNRLYQERLDKSYDTWMASLKNKAFIEIHF